MSTLILFLPPARPGPATEYSYTLTADGHTALRHATAPAALLPEPTRPGGEVVAVVPARALSWQRVQLPPGLALGAGQQTPRLRSVLEGLLEDRLLDDASQLHFAIQPDANPGEPVWVAVCDRTWLRPRAETLRPWCAPTLRSRPWQSARWASAWLCTRPASGRWTQRVATGIWPSSIWPAPAAPGRCARRAAWPAHC